MIEMKNKYVQMSLDQAIQEAEWEMKIQKMIDDLKKEIPDENGYWYVKDFGDGWVRFGDVIEAAREAKRTGATMKFSFSDPDDKLKKKYSSINMMFEVCDEME